MESIVALDIQKFLLCSLHLQWSLDSKLVNWNKNISKINWFSSAFLNFLICNLIFLNNLKFKLQWIIKNIQAKNFLMKGKQWKHKRKQHLFIKCIHKICKNSKLWNKHNKPNFYEQKTKKKNKRRISIKCWENKF